MELLAADEIIRKAVARVRNSGITVTDSGCGCCGEGILLRKKTGVNWSYHEVSFGSKEEENS